jgi:hypothetical protein
MELHVGDEFVREASERARELGLLENSGIGFHPWLTTEQAADYL